MVTPASAPLQADALATYQRVVHQAIDVFKAIIALYQPDSQTPGDWADITVSEATTQCRELQLRLLTPKLKAVSTMTLVSTLGHHLDTHWADYERVLTPNPAKRQQVEQLHAKLEALIEEIAPVSNALKEQERAK